MKIVAQMDEISSIKIKTDTTFLLLLAAQKRGHEIFYYHPSQLCFESCNSRLTAPLKKLKLYDREDDFFEIIAENTTDLKEIDVLLIRQDPPFDMSYLTATYLLERIKNQVLVLNNPSEIRNCPEKIFVTDFPDLTPPTIVTADCGAVLDFLKIHQKIVIKPLYAFGGESVLLLEQEDCNLTANIEMMLALYRNLPFIAQKFIPAVIDGDKRIFLVDGKPIASILRKARAHEIRANMAAGGTPQKTELNERDLEICTKISPFLQQKNLFLAGIDVIGEYLTEINTTSPTGIAAMNRLYGQNFEDEIILSIEQKFHEFSASNSLLPKSF